MYQQYRSITMSDRSPGAGDESDRPDSLQAGAGDESDRSDSMQAAAQAGDLNMVERLLERAGLSERDSRLRDRDGAGTTALYRAAEGGHRHVVEYLLQTGAHVNARRRHRWTPLHAAARHDYPEVVTQLVQAGADIHRSTNRGLTPLMLAAKHGHTGTVRTLVSLGAEVNTGDMFGRSAAFWAVKSGSKGIVEQLVEAGADLSWTDSFKKTLVIQAVKSNQPEILRYFLGLGLDATAEEKRYRAPVHMAVVKGRAECLRVLLDHGITPDTPSSNFRRPLQIAGAECQYRALETLLRCGADVRIQNTDGSTPLHELALTSRLPPRRGRPDRPLCGAALLLLRAGVDLEAASTARSLRWRPDDPSPLTALEVAAKHGRSLHLIQLLALAGARPHRLLTFFDSEPEALVPGLRNNPLVLNWLQAYYGRPRGLRELCRGTVRGILGTHCRSTLPTLPVPRDLAAYLDYSDLEQLAASECLNHTHPDNNSECDYNPSVFDSDYGDDPTIVDTD